MRALLALAALLISPQLCAAQLYVRGSSAADARPIARIAREGVVVGDRTTALVPWHNVKAVRGEYADEARPYLPIAERAWRAKSRLERRDIELAARLFGPLFEEYDTGDGPTSAMIAQGQLACTLAQAKNIEALAPFLATLAGREDALAPGVLRLDHSTRFAPDLPPFWISPRAAHELSAARPDESDASADQFAVASMYLLLAIDPPAIEPGERMMVAHDSDDPGQAMLHLILSSRIGSPEQREGARKKLGELIDSDPGVWAESWCRIALGRSLLREPDKAEHRRAVIEFLHVPSHLDVSPRVTGLALAFAADALIELGELDQAQRVAGLLNRYSSQTRTLRWIEQRLDTAVQTSTSEEAE